MPTWIKFKLIDHSFYDPRTGAVLDSIEGRRNRPGIDPFEGMPRVYPDVDPAKILNWKEGNGELLLKLDMDQAEVDALMGSEEIKKYKASPKVEKEYKANKDFAPVIVPDEIADPVVEPESGVTEKEG